MEVTDDWHQEQQTKFNYAKYDNIDLEIIGKFTKMNSETMKSILDPNYKVQTYVINESEETMFYGFSAK